MNRYKNSSLFLVLLAALLVLGACQKEQKVKNVPAQLQEFVWYDEREKPFGIFEYDELTKAEAEELLEQKFSLQEAVLTEEFEKCLDEGITDETIKAGEPIYSLAAQETSLKVRGYYTYYKEEDLVAFAYIDTEYQYDSESKEVRLLDQTLSLAKPGSGSTFPQNNGEELIQQLGEILKIDDLDAAMAQFKEKYPESSKSEITVSDNGTEAYDNHGIRKALIARVTNKEIVEIYARLVDYTE